MLESKTATERMRGKTGEDARDRVAPEGHTPLPPKVNAERVSCTALGPTSDVDMARAIEDYEFVPMDEPNPGAAPVESPPSAISYKDRSVGLIVFGILTILLGCLCGSFIPLVLIGHVASAKATGTPQSLSTLLPATVLYSFLAVALIWLGIGSIKARRWARALLLIFSWSWLIIGVVCSVLMMLILPKIMANLPSGGTSDQPAMPAAALGAVMLITGLIFGVFFVIVPAVWTFFYNSRHVKATCLVRDPVTRWTDACPLPVLGMCLWLAFSVPMMLIMPIAGRGVMPFFGVFLSGVPGSILCLVVAAVWAYSAWSLYKLQRQGWWLILIAMCVFIVSALLTYARHDVMEMYRLAGYPEAQLQQIQKFGWLSGNRMMWLMAFSMLPFLSYLLLIRRFLFRKS